jgi:hypothetical protein
MQIVYDVNIISENFNVEPIECYIWEKGAAVYGVSLDFYSVYMNMKVGSSHVIFLAL